MRSTTAPSPARTSATGLKRRSTKERAGAGVPGELVKTNLLGARMGESLTREGSRCKSQMRTASLLL